MGVFGQALASLDARQLTEVEMMSNGVVGIEGLKLGASESTLIDAQGKILVHATTSCVLSVA